MALHIKLSAANAGLFASILFFLGMVHQAGRTLLDWAFPTTTWRMSWRTSIEVVGTISGVVFAAMFVSTFLELRTSDHRKETAVQSFGSTAFVRVFSASAVLAVLLFWALGGFGDRHDPILTLVLSLPLGLLAFFCWPRTITLDEVGISQRSSFGIRRTIPYNEVAYISYEPKKQTTLVVGPALRTIKHTARHSDRALFQSLIEERTTKEVRLPTGLAINSLYTH